MAITSLPTKTDGSLGRVKSDASAATDLDTDYPAAEHERIKDALIEVATEVGLSDGSTAGSLNKRVASLEAETTLFWEWNGTDTTQFDSPKTYQRIADTGNSATSRSISVSNAPWGGGKQLVMDVNTQKGGAFWPINDLPSTLPDTYILELEYCSASASWTGAGNPFFVIFGDDAGGSTGLNAADINAPRGGGISYPGVVVDSKARGGVPMLCSGNTWDIANMKRGMRITAEVSRQKGANPAAWRVWAAQDGGAAVSSKITGSRDATQDRAAIDNGDWDGLDMTLCGPGIYVGGTSGSAGLSLSFGLRYIRIWSRKSLLGT